MTDSYSLREVGKLLGLSRSTLNGLIDAGFVTPSRGRHREYRFSFHDLVVLRAARGLSDAKLPPARILRSLRKLRSALPGDASLAGLRIEAVGSSVVVNDGRTQWQPDDGQYVLRFNLEAPEPGLRIVATAPAASGPTAEEWFARGEALEDSSPNEAGEAYRHAIAADARCVAAYTNLGRLLHQQQRFEEAEAVYRSGLVAAGPDGLLLFNLATLLEDLQRSVEAIATYRRCIEQAPEFADAHYNLALLCEAEGRHQDAIRHLSEFRRLS